ncbi:MAG: hypothetical protein ACTSU5_04815 [Promethearchaeota archaeon]
MEKEADGLISDFFEHIIWDVLNNVLFEIKSDVSLSDLREEIKAHFLGRLKRKLTNDEFEEKVRESIDKFDVDPSLTGFFLDLLWQFLGKLNFYFQEHKDPDSKIKDLRDIVYEYMLVSYFENIILAPVMKLVFINRNIHYGMIYGFKVKCNELFKAALDKSLSINEIQEAFHEEISKLDLPDIIVKSIEAIIFSFFESLAGCQDIDAYVQKIKRILVQKKPLLKLEESPLVRSRGEVSILQRWFVRETLDIAVRTLERLKIPLKLTLHDVRTKTLEAFTQLVHGNLTFDTYSERIKAILELENGGSLVPNPTMEIFKQTITSIFALGEIVWAERQKDPTLWHFIQYVKEQEHNRHEMFI